MKIVRFDNYKTFHTSDQYVKEVNTLNSGGELNKILTVKLLDEVVLSYCINQNVVFIKESLSVEEMISIITKLITLIESKER